MATVRSFKKGLTVPTLNIQTDEDVLEFTGALMGDGCLSKYYSKYDKNYAFEVVLTGNVVDDLQYYSDRLIPIIRSKFNSKANYYLRPGCNTIYLRMKNRSVFDLFEKFGVPVGEKKDKIRAPAFVLKGTASAKAAFLRGMLDTDGHIFARKDEEYKYPYVKITSASAKFLEDLKEMIRGLGLPAYIHDTDVLIRGKRNIKLWMKKIGTSHPVHRARYEAWLSTGKMMPKGLVA